MSTEIKKEIALEIAHILFIDTVGYSKLSINDQTSAVDELNEVVRRSEQFRKAEAAGRLIKIPTGDGMALVFHKSSEEPVECALEISRTLKEHPRVQLRMGVHSGPVSGVIDVNGHANLAGAGLNTAQRVMHCGDAGHILLSRHVAEDLEGYEQWRPLLHDLGFCEGKHGVKLQIVNLYADEVGNRELPAKFRAQRRGVARTRWILLAASLLLLAAVVAAFVVVSRHAARSTSAIPEKSIAVLPFDNLSTDEANAFFGDGIQDEILNDLAKVADLKVISRTSVMQYKTGAKRNLREIANALGVAHVVEGTVQRAANRVRVSAQLIDARTDNHMWAEHYDRPLDDIFAIQTEIAKVVVDQLQAKLSPVEKARIDRKPTQNVEAYLAFVQAHDLFTRPDKFRANAEKAEQLFEQATKLDPNFAGAFAGLASVEDFIYHTFDPTLARKEKARAAANEANRLQPDLPEAHLALGFYHYYCERDYQGALNEFAIAKKTLPNSAEVYMAIGAIERRQGKWAQSTENYERAALLSPNDAYLLENLGNNYRANKNFEKADKLADRAIKIAPNALGQRQVKATLAMELKGDFSEMEKQLALVPPGVDPEGLVTLARVNAWILQRKFAAALAALKQLPQEAFYDRPPSPMPKAFLEGILYTYLNDKEKARSAFEHARPIAEQALQESPDDASRHAMLGQILAGLGQKEKAIAEGKRAVEILPESKDALDGPQMTVWLAQIYAWTGEYDQALQLLDHSLSTPNGITAPILKLDPVWDPLRGDPRFQKLCEEKQK